MDSKSKLFVQMAAIVALALPAGSIVSAESNPAKAPMGQSTSMSKGKIHQGDIQDTENLNVISVEELSLHMDGARLADTNKDYKTAAAELRNIQAHVQSQMTALKNADKRLTDLIADMPNGKVTPAELDKAFVQVRHAMDRTHNWIPVASEEVDVFMPEMDYHLVRAKQEWQAGNKKASSKDVRLAVSYLRLRQDALSSAKEGSRDALKKAEKSLSTLASEIRQGKSLTAQKIDSEFGAATAAWNGSF